MHIPFHSPLLSCHVGFRVLVRIKSKHIFWLIPRYHIIYGLFQQFKASDQMLPADRQWRLESENISSHCKQQQSYFAKESNLIGNERIIRSRFPIPDTRNSSLFFFRDNSFSAKFAIRCLFFSVFSRIPPNTYMRIGPSLQHMPNGNPLWCWHRQIQEDFSWSPAEP